MTTETNDVASKIKRARKAAGLTQRQAAEDLGIPLSSYQAYEQGKVTPPYERASKILGVLSSYVVEQKAPEHIITSVEQTEEAGAFYLVLSMNGQAFYRFRCTGEVLGDVQFDIDLEASVQPRSDPEE